MSRHNVLVIGADAQRLFHDPEVLASNNHHVIPAYFEDEIRVALDDHAFDAVLISESDEFDISLNTALFVHERLAGVPIVYLSEGENADAFTGKPSYLEMLPISMDAPLVIQFLEMTIEQAASSKNKNQKAPNVTAGNEIPSEVNEALESMLIGDSPAIHEVRRQILEVAPTDMSVLVRGETGTGKDVIARLIHLAGPGERGLPYVKICCPALPEQLLESELFGHEAGAFTGALKRKPGRLEMAGGGSTFLDEVTEMPPSVQAKLLEVLEQKTFTRVGGNTSIHIDTTFIAATNVPQHDIFEVKGFREDLYYRLNQYAIEIPPLRERAEDIPLLSQHFLTKYGQMYNNTDLRIAPEDMARMMAYQWPGNIRELESIVRRYALTAKEDTFQKEIPEPDAPEPKPVVVAHIHTEPVPVDSTLSTFQDTERRLILNTLNETRWNRRAAAKVLGVSYNTLRRRIAQYELV